MPNMRAIDLIVVHCSDTPPTMRISVDDIRRWHTSPPRNWLDIGYHWVILRDGDIEQGRDEAIAGAHVKGHNDNSIGVCLVGGRGGRFDYTSGQLDALRRLLLELKARYPNVTICGHRDLNSAKTCPNFDVEWFASDLSDAVS